MPQRRRLRTAAAKNPKRITTPKFLGPICARIPEIPCIFPASREFGGLRDRGSLETAPSSGESATNPRAGTAAAREHCETRALCASRRAGLPATSPPSPPAAAPGRMHRRSLAPPGGQQGDIHQADLAAEPGNPARRLYLLAGFHRPAAELGFYERLVWLPPDPAGERDEPAEPGQQEQDGGRLRDRRRRAGVDR
jgi:hypothetical protein